MSRNTSSGCETLSIGEASSWFLRFEGAGGYLAAAGRLSVDPLVRMDRDDERLAMPGLWGRGLGAR